MGRFFPDDYETQSQHEVPPMNADEPEVDPPSDRADAGPGRTVKAEELFGDQREVWIELDGVRYRLRITRRGKLILQK